MTDGGREILALTDRISPCSEYVLDWFHVTMKITVLGQFAKVVAHLDAPAGAQLEEDLARIKWKLWHGNSIEAQDLIDRFKKDVSDLGVDYPNLRKFEVLAREFGAYVTSNTVSVC